MMKKLFAAAICGAVIASVSTHADAAGPAGLARQFSAIEREAVALVPPLTSADKIDVSRQEALSAVDGYFDGFNQTQAAK